MSLRQRVLVVLTLSALHVAFLQSTPLHNGRPPPPLEQFAWSSYPSVL